MTKSRRHHRLASAAMALVMALAAPLGTTTAPLLRLGVVGLASGVTLVSATEAEARRSGSGGFSRPSSASRTPSAAPSRSSSAGSGGFTRPSGPPPSARTPPVSGADRDFGRAASGRAFEEFQVRNRPPPQPVTPPAASLPPPPRGATGAPQGPASVGAPAVGTGGGGGTGSTFGGAVIGSVIGNVLSDLVFSPRPRTPQASAPPVETAPPRTALEPTPAPSRSAAAPQAPASSGGGGWLIWLLLALAVAAAWWWWRRRTASAAAPPVTPQHAMAAKETQDMTVRTSVGAMVMLDPTPFLLVGSALGITPPRGGPVSVDAVSTLTGGPVPIERLYLGSDGSFIELIRDRSGGVERARWFGRLAEVQPADAEEWGFWLDDADGMIGWPVFQTQDGRQWQRVWGTGGGRARPFSLHEEREDLEHRAARDLEAMLYQRPADSGDTQLFLLVAAANTGPEAWVEVHVGLEINPMSLTLTPSHLASGVR